MLGVDEILRFEAEGVIENNHLLCGVNVGLGTAETFLHHRDDTVQLFRGLAESLRQPRLLCGDSRFVDRKMRHIVSGIPKHKTRGTAGDPITDGHAPAAAFLAAIPVFYFPIHPVPSALSVLIRAFPATKTSDDIGTL